MFARVCVCVCVCVCMYVCVFVCMCVCCVCALVVGCWHTMWIWGAPDSCTCNWANIMIFIIHTKLIVVALSVWWGSKMLQITVYLTKLAIGGKMVCKSKAMPAAGDGF